MEKLLIQVLYQIQVDLPSNYLQSWMTNQRIIILAKRAIVLFVKMCWSLISYKFHTRPLGIPSDMSIYLICLQNAHLQESLLSH